MIKDKRARRQDTQADLRGIYFINIADALDISTMLPWSVISIFRCLGLCCKCRWWRRAKTCPWSKWREDEGSSRCEGERVCPSLQVIILLKYILMIHFFCHPGNVRDVVLGFGATTQFAVHRRRWTLSSSWSKFGAHGEHGEHGDVFLFSNLGVLWFSENFIRYSLHVCLREVKNNLFSFKHSYLRHFSWRF